MIQVVFLSLLALGLFNLITRRTLLGVMVGAQFLISAIGLGFVFVGQDGATRGHGHLVAVFLLVFLICQLVVGLSLAIRFRFLKDSGDLSKAQSLRH